VVVALYSIYLDYCDQCTYRTVVSFLLTDFWQCHGTVRTSQRKQRHAYSTLATTVLFGQDGTHEQGASQLLFAKVTHRHRYRFTHRVSNVLSVSLSTTRLLTSTFFFACRHDNSRCGVLVTQYTNLCISAVACQIPPCIRIMPASILSHDCGRLSASTTIPFPLRPSHPTVSSSLPIPVASISLVLSSATTTVLSIAAFLSNGLVLSSDFGLPYPTNSSAARNIVAIEKKTADDLQTHPQHEIVSSICVSIPNVGPQTLDDVGRDRTTPAHIP
jgi:hypothetical protein